MLREKKNKKYFPNPTPEERAEFTVRELEGFIRKKRGNRGVSYSEWQDMAKREITNTLIEAEKDYHEYDRIIRRLLISIAAVLVTIGFWGTALAFDKSNFIIIGTIFTIAGLWLFAIVLDWRLRHYFKAKAGKKRIKSLQKIDTLTRRIKNMERELEEETEQLEETLKKV